MTFSFLRISGSPMIFLGVALMTGCGIYKFNGASINPEAKTVNVKLITSKAPLAPPTLGENLTEVLRNKITSQSRLVQVNSDSADYVFNGYVSGYDITNAAVINVEQAAALRLTITVTMDFKSRLSPKDNFNQPFSRFEDFSASQSITQVQDQLITQINKDISDDIFNRAFVNW
ncbi:MAG TPA: LPS assembly lipoprotein LptE [Chitinophagaceae bacterium]|nr:LPS assembly lipoprotein LptE [Chitinophagaceae bacterium]